MKHLRTPGDYEFTLDTFSTPDQLCDDAIRALEIPNAGGSSRISEALSVQYMYQKLGAHTFSLEMEISYWIEYKMCDFLMVDNTGENVGVSVTRACPYPFHDEYTAERASELLTRKLYGLIVARDCVSEEHSFQKSILHVWCMNIRVAERICEALEQIRSLELDKTYDGVHVICTVCQERQIYTNHSTISFPT